MADPIVIQSKNAVLSFYKNGWYPYVCASDVSISMSSDMIETRTATGGIWATSTYQKNSFSLSLGGVLVFDAVNWSGLDFIQNWLGFTAVQFMLSMTDDSGTIKSFQGYCNVASLVMAASPGKVVENTYTLPGTGELMFFDGLIPCNGVISTITVTEALDSSGDATITYTYTGAPYQIKYRVDGMGNYIYVLIGTSFVVAGGTIGAHSIEIIPVCSNNYVGTGLTKSYNITHNLTCSAVITNITITTTTATPIYTGSPTTYNYQIDSGTLVTGRPIASSVSLAGLSVGSHSITMTPVCANGVLGTPLTKSFTVSSQPAQSIVNYSMVTWKPGNTLQIYVNGVLNVNVTANGATGNITVPTGATVLGVLSGNQTAGSSATLQTYDNTLGGAIDTRTGTVVVTLSYSFTANGDTYTITGTISP